MPIPGLLDQAGRFAGQIWSQADRAAGGWLPGGGIASPLTRAVFPPQKFPGRAKELERATGVRARFIDPTQSATFVRKLAPLVSSRWGENDYANPVLNEIGISEYLGGVTPRERYVEFHELGHLNPRDKNLASYLGVLGRTLQGISDQTGNLPPIDMLAGVALQYADAPEEDRAERFAQKFAVTGKYSGPKIYSDSSSNYGNMLRREGRELVSTSLNRLADPYRVVSKTTRFLNTQQAKPLQAELSSIQPELKRLYDAAGYGVTPELLELSKRDSKLRAKLRELGVTPLGE